MDDTGVVTPEGVLLDYRPAGLATRTMGRLIDLSLMGIVFYVSFVLGLVLLLSGSFVLVTIYMIALGFFVLFGYPIGFEVYGGGRTPGHRATGTRVIRTDGGPVGLRHSAIRAMLFLVDGIATTGFAGAVSVLVTKRGQRLGDLAAGTMVVRVDRVVMAPGPAPSIGHGLASRASEFDRRRLDRDDVTTARMLMERGAQFREGAQVDLAERVAERLDSQLGNVRLGEDSAVDFIHAVLEGGDGGAVAVLSESPSVVSGPAQHEDGASPAFVAPESIESSGVEGPDEGPEAEDEATQDDAGFAPPT